MNPKGPFVTIATFCERVMREIDGGISCIRLMDTIAIDLAADAPDPFPIMYQGQALISFKSGDHVGQSKLRIQIVNPSGELAKPPLEQPLQFNGGEHGTNSIFQIGLQILTEGLYWMEVFVDNELATRIPLRVRVTRKQPELTNSEMPE